MPDQFFGWLRAHMRKEWTTCFCASLLLGFAAHGYKMLNWLPNWDSLVFRYDAQDMSMFGRWFLSIADGLSSYYDLPWLNSILALIFTGIAAVCIFEIFSLKSTIAAVLVGGLTVSFPGITSTLAYSYTADGYCLALLLSVLSVLIAVKGQGILSALSGSFLLALSCGIYQAYLSTAIVLVLLYLADQLLFSTAFSVKTLCMRALRFFMFGVAGCLLYLLFMNLSLRLSGTELSSYQGIDSAAIAPMYAAKQCVLMFMNWFFSGLPERFSLFTVLNIVELLFMCTLLLKAVLLLKTDEKAKRCSGVCLIVFLLPFAACSLYFINPNIIYHSLMLGAYSIFYLIPVICYERMNACGRVFRCFKQWGILVVSAVLIYCFVVTANVSAHKLQLGYERDYGLCVRIADRIEQLAGTDSEIAFMTAGKLPGGNVYYADLPPRLAGTTDGSILLDTDPSIQNQNTLMSMLNDYCGKHFVLADPEKQDAIKASAAFQQMPCWPQIGSVKMIDDVLVVRFEMAEPSA